MSTIPATFRATRREWYVAINQWSRLVFERALADPDDVEELYGHAVALGLLQASEQNRFRVFCQAAHDARHARHPGAIFKTNIAFNKWFADQDDEHDAVIMMKRINRKRSTMPGDFKLLFSIIARHAIRLMCLLVRFFQPKVRGDK